VAERQCYHCKEWIPEGAPHDCWTTTEAALTRDLPEDLLDAWERLRETAAEFGEQRIYASGTCIMFARTTCYFFVRPRVRALELCVFLGRTVTSPLVRRADPRSRTKIAHTISLTHRDQVEAPLTDWLREAYDTSEKLSASARSGPVRSRKKAAKPSGKAAKGRKRQISKPTRRTTRG
jgi:uncharacterized protein DUF5655